jgi:hypothetical protein
MMNVGMRSFYPIGVLRGVRPFCIPSRMRRLLPLPTILLAALAPPALGAEIYTDRACYLETAQTTATVRGSGFAPMQPYTAMLDGAPLGNSTTNEQGFMQAALRPPLLAARENQHLHTVLVQADQTASTTFTVTRFVASFAPTKGDPARLRVRFSVFGFGLGGGTPDIYVHYVAPGGKPARTVRLGRAQGQCGSLARTRLRRLFPFTPRHGRWRLQFDTSRQYQRGVKGSPFLFYTVGVTVRSAK